MTYLQRLAEIESRNNPLAQNPMSTAKGLYQFINSTGKQYGINAPFGTPEYTQQETAAVQDFTADNYAALKSALQRDPTEGELYLAHQQGAGGAIKLLSNPQARAIDVLGPYAVVNNGGDPNMTAGEFANKWVSKFSGEQSLNMAQQSPDLSQMSDEELMQAAGMNPAAGISDEELKKIAGVEEPGIIDKMKQGQQEAADLYTSGQQGMASTILQGAATGADAINEVAGNALSAITPDFIGEPLQRGVQSAVSAVANSDLGRSALAKYGEFSQAHPTAARNLSALTRIGTVLAPFGKVGGKSLAGSALETTGKGAGAVGRAAVSPLVPSVDEAIAPLAIRAEEFGIPLRLDQVSPTRARKTLQKISQEVPFSGVDAFEESQRASFTKALAKTIGQDADNLGPETIKNFLDSATNKFDGALKGEMISVKDGDFGRLDDILADAELTMTGDLKDIVSKNVEKLKTDIGEGAIPGEKLASFRSQLLKRIPKAPAESKQALGEIVDTIDGMIEKSIPAEKQTILKEARREWRNYKTLEPLLEKSTDGFINPTNLMSRVSASPYIKASRTSVGEDDLVDLARIGKEFLPKAGGSDTFQKSALAGLTVGNAMAPAAIPATLTTLAGNRLFQGAYNQNQNLVKQAVKKGSGSKVYLENMADPDLVKQIKKNTK